MREPQAEQMFSIHALWSSTELWEGPHAASHAITESDGLDFFLLKSLVAVHEPTPFPATGRRFSRRL